MKYLLLADLPPCNEYTGGQVLLQLASFLRPDSLVCYIVRDTRLIPLPVVSPELGDIAVQYDTKPNEYALRALPGPFGAASACPVEFWRRVLATRAIQRRAVAFARANQVTAVWAVLQGQTLARIARRVAEELDVPLYTQVWDPLSWWLRDRRIDRYSAKRSIRDFEESIRASTRTLAPSWAMAEHLREAYGASCEPIIFSLPANVLVKGDEEARRAANPVVIGMAGQIYAQEEWRSLLRTLEIVQWKIAGRDVEIHYAGGGFAKDLDHPNVLRLGWLSPTEVVRRMSVADVLYLPYWFTEAYREPATFSFPSKLVTYFAASKPILFHGPEYASPARYLREREAGLLCHSLTPSNIFNSLSALIQDAGLRQRLVSNGRSAFLRDFTLETMAAHFWRGLEVPEHQRAEPRYVGETNDTSLQGTSASTGAHRENRQSDQLLNPQQEPIHWRRRMREFVKLVAMALPPVRRYVERHRQTVEELRLAVQHRDTLRAERDTLRSERDTLRSVQASLEGQLRGLVEVSAARFRLSELWYRDLMTGLRNSGAFGRLPRLELRTEHPVAKESDDHLHPWGTAVDNTRWLRFVGACERTIERRPLHVMDLGCAGGGMVLDFVLSGHHAVGVEGSDFSLVNRRAEWRTLPDRLFTADISHPFTVSEAGGAEPVSFDVITAWDVLEHVAEEDLTKLFDNVTRHLHSQGRFIGTIAVVPDRNEQAGVDYHRTVRPREWWVQRFAEAGLDMMSEHPFHHDDFCRGIGNPLNPNDVDYRKMPDVGFHFFAKRR